VSRGGRLRKRLRREGELEGALASLDEAPPAQMMTAPPPTLADRTLELQRSAGNRATGAAIHRWGGPALHAAAQWPKTTQLRLGSFSIPVESYSASSEQSGVHAPGAGQRFDSFTGPGTMSLVLQSGDWEDDLMLTMRGDPRRFEKAELLVPARDGTGGWRWILTGVELTGVSWVPSGEGIRPPLHVTLDFKRRESSDKPR